MLYKYIYTLQFMSSPKLSIPSRSDSICSSVQGGNMFAILREYTGHSACPTLRNSIWPQIYTLFIMSWLLLLESNYSNLIYL